MRDWRAQLDIDAHLALGGYATLESWWWFVVDFRGALAYDDACIAPRPSHVSVDAIRPGAGFI